MRLLAMFYALLCVAVLLAAMPRAAFADVRVAVQIPVGPKPASSPTPCKVAKATRFAAYIAQAADALVVSNDVRHGAQSATIFGKSSSPFTYAASFAVEDVLADLLTRRAACPVKAGTQAILGAGALNNALESGATK